MLSSVDSKLQKWWCIRQNVYNCFVKVNEVMWVSAHVVAIMVSSMNLAFPSLSTGWDITEDFTCSTRTHTNRYQNDWLKMTKNKNAQQFYLKKARLF